MKYPLSRRGFLAATAAATLATAFGTGRAHAAGIVTGAQSYSFRNFSFEDSLKRLKEVGLNTMEFCAVHFPPDATAEGFEGVKAAIAAAGISVPCYGVEGFGADDGANRKKFEFGKALGLDILTADVEPKGFDSVEKLCEEFNIKIAIHNHGPHARYDKVADTLKAVEGRSPLIGACLDTGHCIRSAEKPHEVVKALGPRLISMHLKDWITGGEEQIIGEGDLDLAALVAAMKEVNFTGPVMMEYENSPEAPVADMQKGLANWNAAWA